MKVQVIVRGERQDADPAKATDPLFTVYDSGEQNVRDDYDVGPLVKDLTDWLASQQP